MFSSTPKADIDGECGHKDQELALPPSKVEAIIDDYNRLLASRLEIQKQHYESLLAEARSWDESSISEAVEKAVAKFILGLSQPGGTHSSTPAWWLPRGISEAVEEAVKEKCGDLIREQEVMRRVLKVQEERELSQQKRLDEVVMDLEERMRRVKLNVESRTRDSDSTDGGTDSDSGSDADSDSSSGNPTKRTKLGSQTELGN